MTTEAEIKRKFKALSPVLDERVTRLWAATEAEVLGRGGIAIVERATGLSRTTIRVGMEELRAGAKLEDVVNVRRTGGGRPSIEQTSPGIIPALEELVDPVTRGDPESPLRWTSKSTRKLADELSQKGFVCSPQKVGQLLHASGYSLQSTNKTLEGASHPDRNEQFEFINARVDAFHAIGAPVISVDTKKKELVGDFANAGREWQPQGQPVPVRVHDFIDPALGKAIPYGVYDLARNDAWVSVGVDHDTPEFAVHSIAQWWRRMGRRAYPDATELLITADAGGSNSSRSRLWKTELQDFADRTGLAISVCHFPPGTSKWNKIEHRLFCHITENWRGRPLVDHETVVQLIGSVRTRTGLTVKAALDTREYVTGTKVSDDEMALLSITHSTFHGDWNYTIRPRHHAKL
ncbi:MAG TPA: ISAzo13 family transposase [Candidatus Paceibacterota bacterium]|nr:ISAzo13 family transposase [Candidatus Paceibacterota bacterium]